MADGDEAAWSAFVGEYGPKVAGIVRRMMVRRLGRAEQVDVDEITSEVFLALLRHDRLLLRRFDPHYRLLTWLGVIARTALGRRLRKRAAVEVGLRHPVPADPEQGDPELRARMREGAEAAQRALGLLGDRDRLLLRLRFLEGLDYAAIAEALSLQPSSIGPLLARAKARFREAWA